MRSHTEYHVHTELSLLDSCTNYRLYVDRAVELGQTAIAFTEHGNIYNWIEKKMYTESKGLKYIHGVECYLTASLEEKKRDNYHTILLAKNYAGVQELNLLIDKSTQEDHFYYKPRISFDEFFNISDNIIKISACLASPLNKYPKSTCEIDAEIKTLTEEYEANKKKLELEKSSEEAFQAWLKDNGNKDVQLENDELKESYIEYKDMELEDLTKSYEANIEICKHKIALARENFDRLLQTYDYYEIQPHDFPEQRKYNEFLYMASQRYDKPLIVGTDTHSIDYYKAQCRSILQKAKRIEYADEDKFDLTQKSTDKIIKMFKKQACNIPFEVIMQALENTNIMADSIEPFILDTSIKYPKLYDDEETVLKQRIVDKLKYKLENGIIKRENLEKYKANILEEMRVFKKINMIGFMLFMSELVCWCWDNGIPIGPCRGSVGGSTVAFITDIIDVDPIVWNTIFSRFANEDREEVGDIDIDISPDQRELVYQHIIDTFTYEKTAYILAIGTISDKGTIDEIGRALDIPLETVAAIKDEYSLHKDTMDSTSKRIKEIESMNEFKLILKADKDSEYYNLRKNYESQVHDFEHAQAMMKNLQENKYRELFFYFDGLNGTAISQSMHPAGIVVSPITLPDNYGTFWSKGKRILFINMEEIHDGAGLVKYDLLGLKNIQIIRKAYEYIGIPYPKSHQINWNDKKVWDDITCSPAGVFQFESSYAFDMLKDYKPQCVNDLSMINASLRPSGASYRDRLLAGEINKNPSPLIDELLKENRGFLIFQEDTIKFLQNICGLSGSEADNVRRAIGRKNNERLQAALPKILEGYCKMSPQPREVAEEEAKAFIKIIEDSANYQFGQNHSTGYSMIGYMCAYCRYYYPEEFIAAYLNCANNTDDIVMGTELAKIKNVTIYNIKFGKSRAEYAVDKKNHALYKGIASIKFCNSQIAEELYEISKNTYKDFTYLLDDINNFTTTDSRQLSILIGLDYFSEYGKNQYLLDIVKIYDTFAKCKQIKKDKMVELGLTELLMQTYAKKETAKLYKDIDNVGLIAELASRVENRSMSIVQQIKFELEYLQYAVYMNDLISDVHYIVIDYKTYKEARKPYCVLYNLHTGESVKARVASVKVYEYSPFGLYSILRINQFTKKNKKKCVNGSWVETDELENILDEYEVISKKK